MIKFLKDFMKSLWIISILLTIPTLLFVDFTKNIIWNNWTYYFIIILLISLIYWIIRTLPLKNINIKIKNKLNVIIKYWDLFSEKGIIVIPVNEYFDTIVDDEIISKNTIHWQFINKYFLWDTRELDNKIKIELNNIESIEKNNSRKKWKKNKYKLWTSIKIRLNNEQVAILIVLSKFNSNNTAYIKRWYSYNINIEFQNFFILMLEWIYKYSQWKNVNISLIWSWLSWLPLDKQKNLEYILFLIYLYSWILKDRNELIQIILHKDNKKEISLNKINTF